MSKILQADPKLPAKERLIYPLDTSDVREAKNWITLLKGRIGLFKVGLELFVAAGPDILKVIARSGRNGVFLDLKFHDIPATVLAAARAMPAKGISFISVHAANGAKALKAVVHGTPRRTKVLAITVLTSMSQVDLAATGVEKKIKIPGLVLKRAFLARKAGCAGIVCSGSEVRLIKQKIGKNLLAVVPGVRPEWSRIKGDDQKRVSTPREAILNGADYLVVGRPIRMARNPLQAADRIVGEIQQAMDELRGRF